MVLASGLTMMIGREDDLQVVGVSRPALDNRSAIEASHADVVLLGCTHVDGFVLRTCRSITDTLTEIRVVVLTDDQDPTAIHRAWQSGATGLAHRRDRLGRVFDALRSSGSN